jgi:hypothetical protein
VRGAEWLFFKHKSGSHVCDFIVGQMANPKNVHRQQSHAFLSLSVSHFETAKVITGHKKIQEMAIPKTKQCRGHQPQRRFVIFKFFVGTPNSESKES